MKEWTNNTIDWALGGLAAVIFAMMIFAVTYTPSVQSGLTAVKVSVEGGHGSAVHLGKGLYLTAAHVVADTETVTINGEPAEVLWKSDKDVALLKSAPSAQSYDLRCTPLVVGEEVTIVGYPLMSPGLYTWGKIAGLDSGYPEINLMVIDGMVAPGNSGGPVFDANGDVVGIVNALYTAAFGWSYTPVWGYSLATPNTTLCALLAQGT